jgi:hypothetical protein
MTIENEKTNEKLADEVALDAVINDGAIVSDTVTDENAAQGAQSETVEQSMAGLIGLIAVGLNFTGYKKLSKVWADTKTNNQLAEKAVPVLKKHTWGRPILDFLSGNTAQEELALFMVVLPLGMASMSAYRDDVSEKKTIKEQSEKPAEVVENEPA